MKRRLVKQGNNTLTLSLPREWCDSNKLKEGDEIDINERTNCIIISKENFRGSDEIKVDITGLDRSTIILLIQSLYTYGHSSIVITSKDSKAKYFVNNKNLTLSTIINDAVSRLMGAEIISSSNNTFQIQVLAEESREKFDVTIKRIFVLLEEMFKTFIDGLNKRSIDAGEAVNIKHVTIKRFVNYALRILNKSGHEDASKTNFYFSIVNYLGKISEIIKNTSRRVILNYPTILSPECIKIVESMGQTLEIYHKLYLKYNLSLASDIERIRDEYWNRIYLEKEKDLSKEDLLLIGSLSQINDIVLDLVQLRIALEH